jgi:hypothetical protein
MKKIFFVVLAILIPSLRAADYQSEIDAFFKLYNKKQYSDAVDRLYESNKSMLENQKDDLNNLKKTISGYLKEGQGEFQYAKKIEEYKLCDIMVHVVYLLVYENTVVRIQFQFFRANQGWVIEKFAFDTNISDELAEVANRHSILRQPNPALEPSAPAGTPSAGQTSRQ